MTNGLHAVAPGNRYGSWEVLDEEPNRKGWYCLCRNCGVTKKRVRAHDLRSGKSLMCRHCSVRVSRVHKVSPKHESEYRSWQAMIRRCTDSNHKDYPNYGGRGIVVCSLWENSFEAFLMTMGPKPDSSYTVERLDYDKNYEPTNCKWASKAEQSRNKRDNVLIDIDGETKTVSQWSKDPRCSVTAGSIYKRIDRGWDAKKAVLTPSKK